MIEKMEGLALNVITTTSISPSFRSPIFTRLRVKTLTFSRSKSDANKFAVFASNDEPKLDPLDQMELQFGRLLGEDPQLTIAKIMARKADPDASYLEVEKNYNKNKNKKNKGKTGDVEMFPIEWSNAVKSPPPSPSPLDGLNLARPVPKKGFEFKVAIPDDVASPLDGLNLARPMPKKGFEFKVGKPDDVASTGSGSASIKRPSQPGVVRRSVPNVILRKPSPVNNPDVEDKPSRVRLRRNLSLAMMSQPAVKKEEFSDMTLLRKSEPVVAEEENTSAEEEKNGIEASDFSLMPKPEAKAVEATANDVSDTNSIKSSVNGGFEDDLLTEKPRFQQVDPSSTSSIREDTNTAEKEIHSGPVSSDANLSVEAALVGKPKRLDPSSMDKVDPESVEKPANIENLEVPLDIKGPEDDDWVRLETLLKTGDRGEVELLSCSARGFAVSFGSLIGFIPYRNLSSKYKFLAIESWLRQKGLDPSKYRQGLGIIGETANNAYLIDSNLDKKEIKPGREVSADMKMEEILAIYDQEKIKFLSSFVGQRVKANVVMANQRSGKLLFSVKPREREESVARKRSLMAKLQIGDIVKGCITKITYFGIFVEIEGVPALVHQTEVSWDATLDPLVYFKVGQIIEAKVQQLDFALDRIFLSLKEIMPDPLVEALEAVVGDRDPLDTRLQPAEAITEWTDVESLIKELDQTEGIQSVSKGRFFLSPGLAPTFQVYMASMFENQYKLLARSGNKVQEVIVETSLDKEELKSTILTCTDRVE